MPDHQPGCLKLGQDAIHGRKADLFAILEQLLIDLIGTEMAVRTALQKLQYANACGGGLQTNLMQSLTFNSFSHA